MLPSHEEYISSLFKFEQFLNEVKYQHFWDLHWLQRSFWTPELPKECIAVSLSPKPIPTYCTELPSQSWPAWEAWRGVKILADPSRNQVPHCRVTHAPELCWQGHRCAGSKPWSGWVIQVSTNAAPEGRYVLGVMHRLCNPRVLEEMTSGVCVRAAQSWDCEPLSPVMEKSFHLSAPRESHPPCLPFLPSFSQPGNAQITISRILWFVPKVPEIREATGSRGEMGFEGWQTSGLTLLLISFP